jgi:histidinol-phosphate/aromatic aminotransferase/cobyric acid decarboxylase-like protein
VSVTDLTHAGQVLTATLQGLDLVHFTRNDTRLDITIHRAIDEPKRQVVFIANPTNESINAEVGGSIL